MVASTEYCGYQLTPHGKKWKVWNGHKLLSLPWDRACAVIDELVSKRHMASKLSHVPTITVKDALLKYEQWATKHRDKTTLRNVKLMWSSYENIPWLHEVTREMVEELIGRKPRSNGTIRSMLFAVRSVLTFASNKKKCGNNYLVDHSIYTIPLPPPDPEEKTMATDEHCAALLAYCAKRDWRIQMMGLAFVHWGCRPATITELQVSGYKDGTVQLKALVGKNRKTKQVMVVPPELKPYLDRAATENARKPDGSGSGYLFHSTDGKPWSIEGVQAFMKRMHKDKILPPEIVWTSFRIRMDNLMIEKGVNPYAHMMMMGHSTRTIGDTYARMTLAKQVAVQKQKAQPIKYTDSEGVEHAFGSVGELSAFLANDSAGAVGRQGSAGIISPKASAVG